MGDAIGLTVLAGLTVLCAAFVPSSEVPPPVFFLVYLMIALIGLYCWHNEKSPQSALGWLAIVVGATVIGAINFGIDAMMGYSNHPQFSLLNAVTSSRDGILTLLLYPVLIFVGLGGAARNFFINTKKGDAKNAEKNSITDPAGLD